MKLRTIPAEVLNAYVAGLSAYVPELTPTRLVAALRGYEPEGETRAPSATPPRMLSLVEAAQCLGVSRDTVLRMVTGYRGKDKERIPEADRLPAVKVGLQWRIPAAAVKALAEVGEAAQ
jgi:hypothetical protein